jgi:hypothetical protein
MSCPGARDAETGAEQILRITGDVDVYNELRVERRQRLKVGQFSVRSFRRTVESDFSPRRSCALSVFCCFVVVSTLLFLTLASSVI